jgi:hypothetical protein
MLLHLGVATACCSIWRSCQTGCMADVLAVHRSSDFSLQALVAVLHCTPACPKYSNRCEKQDLTAFQPSCSCRHQPWPEPDHRLLSGAIFLQHAACSRLPGKHLWSIWPHKRPKPNVLQALRPQHGHRGVPHCCSTQRRSRLHQPRRIRRGWSIRSAVLAGLLECSGFNAALPVLRFRA